MKQVALAVFLVVASMSAAQAQVNSKREACLKEAESKGLYTSGSRNPGKLNASMAPQRQEFMKDCMSRK